MKIQGKISGVSVKSGTNNSGKDYSVALVSLTKVDGNVMKLSTFEVETVQSANGKQVEIDYIVNGDWNNISKNGVKILNGTEPIKVTEEVIGEHPKHPVKEVMTKGHGNSSYYVPDTTKQRFIVRQSCLNQANNYISNVLKAVELGMIEKENMKLSMEYVLVIAKEFERFVFEEK